MQEHRQARSGADSPQHFKSIDAGQHYVQHHQQVTTAAGALQSILAIVHGFHHESLGLQVFADQGAEFDIVVDNQNAFHFRGLHCAPVTDRRR